jgi:hypothetical protein
VAAAAIRPPTSPSDRLRPGHRRVLLGVVVAFVALAVAAAAITEYGSPAPSNGPPPPGGPTGWTTFHSAWNATAVAFASDGSGAWQIDFAEGAAADAPWSPPISLWDVYQPDTWNPCAAQLSGISTLTYWNASDYPASRALDVFSSGTAPLWTFVFHRSGTPTYVASWVAGQVVTNAALAPTSPCLGLDIFSNPGFLSVDPSTEVDSNTIAVRAMEVSANSSSLPVGERPGSVPSPAAPAFALYFPGRELLPFFSETADTWTVAYGACGFAGELGRPYQLTGYSFNSTTGSPGGYFFGNASCFDAYYSLGLAPAVVPNPPPSGLYRGWSVNVSFFSSAVPAVWSAQRLTTAALQFRLAGFDPPYALIPAVPARCGPDDPGLANCTAPTAGWYAVLLGRTGNWLDSFPSPSNASAWTVSAVPVVTGDEIVYAGALGIPTNSTFETPFGTEPTVSASEPLGPT